MKAVLVGWEGPEAEGLLQGLRTWSGMISVCAGIPAAAQELCEPAVPALAVLREGVTAPAAEELIDELRGRCPSPELYVILVLRRTWPGRMTALMDAGADDCVSDDEDVELLEVRTRVAMRALSRQGDLVRACEEYRQRALRDALTGVFNRGAILEILEMELHRAARLGTQVGIVLADLDHFKSINDELGHLAGDAALQQVSEAMRSSLRPYDSLGRYGGEEFLVVLPDCPPTVTSVVAERLRSQIETLRWKPGRSLTLSLGTAHHQGSSPAAPFRYVELADEALYEAKRRGRNRVVPGRPATTVERPVVVVIGDSETLDMFRRSLGHGMDVRACRRVRDAIPHLRVADLVVTDPSLPGSGGLDFLQKARERGLRAPVLVVGGGPAAEGLPSLLKPFRESEVLAAVRSMLPETGGLEHEDTGSRTRSGG